MLVRFVSQARAGVSAEMLLEAEMGSLPAVGDRVMLPDGTFIVLRRTIDITVVPPTAELMVAVVFDQPNKD
jgi:hypothetical protein